jgi:ABC-2 type transport system permease protein
VVVILAILRAQWLSLRNSRLGAARRGGLFALLMSLVWYGFWSVLAFEAYSFTVDPSKRDLVESALPRGLMLIVGYWQLTPIFVAGLGASLDLKKLLIYPVHAAMLFWAEVMLRLTTGKEMLLLLSGSVLGLIQNPETGGGRTALQVVPAAVVFVILNLLVAAGLRSLIERLLARKRIREFVILLAVLSAALPQVLLYIGLPKGFLQHFLADNPWLIWPWAAAGRIMLHGHSGLPWPVLFVWLAAGYWFGRWQFGRSLRFDFQAARAASGESGPLDRVSDRLLSLPSLLLPDPVGVEVEKELKTLARSPRFRLVFIMGFTFGLVIWLPMLFRGPQRGGFLAQNFLTLLCVYALTLLGQVTYWNSFGFDRSAAQVYFSLPVPISKTLIAKNIAAALIICGEMFAVTVACFLLRVQPGWPKIAEAYVVTVVAGVFLMSAGNLASVHLPRPMSPERAGQGGGAGRSQAMILLAYPLALLPILLAYGGRYAFHSEPVFYSLMALMAVLGGIVYWIALDSAVETALVKREQILTELSSAEGPIAAD